MKVTYYEGYPGKGSYYSKNKTQLGTHHFELVYFGFHVWFHWGDRL